MPPTTNGRPPEKGTARLRRKLARRTTRKTPGKAAVKFRELLGKNGDGDLAFPMPAGYNEDGTKRTSATLITPGASNVPAGDRRFG